MLAGFGDAPLSPPPGTTRGSWGVFKVSPTEQAAPMMLRATVLQDGTRSAAIVSLDATNPGEFVHDARPQYPAE
jgi:hypothetical protein